MPLKGKLFKGRKSKRDGDTSSIASTQSQDVHADGYTILKPDKELPFKLHRAVWNGRTEKVIQLLEENTGKSGKPKHDVNAVDKKGRTALHLAAVKEDPALIDLLAATAVSSCRLQDCDGNTPLHKAVECKKYASSVKIIAMTENVDIKNKQGLTPLHIAAINNDVAIAHKLLDKGAYVDECDNDDCTPLSIACSHGCKEFAELMVKEDCNVNCKNNKGLTPLMLAAKDNCSSIVSCLLEAPLIDIDVKDFTGKTASDYSQPDSNVALALDKHRKEHGPESSSTSPPTLSPLGAALSPLGAGTGYLQQGGGTGGNFGASPMDPISAAVATSVAPPTTNLSDDLSRHDTFLSSSDSESMVDVGGGRGGGGHGGVLAGDTSLNMDEATKEKLRKTFLFDDEEEKEEEKEMQEEEGAPYVSKDVPVKSEKDAITRAEMPKLNVYNKSGLSLSSSSSSEEEEKEDNVEQQMRGGEERMGDSPIKERSQPLEATGGVASSNTDAKKSALDDDVLKDNVKDHTTDAMRLNVSSVTDSGSTHHDFKPPSPAKPVEQDNWDWDSSEEEEEEEEEEEKEEAEKEKKENKELHKVKDEGIKASTQQEEEESSKWDSTDDDDDLNENDLPGFDTNPSLYFQQQQSLSTPTTTTTIITSTVPSIPTITAVPTPLNTSIQTDKSSSNPLIMEPTSSQLHSHTPTTSTSTSAIPTIIIPTTSSTAIPSAKVLERTLKSQDSNITTNDYTSTGSNSKLVPQTSTDLRLSVTQEEEDELGGGAISTLGATPKKSGSVPAYRSEPIVTATAGSTSLQSLIAERRRANQVEMKDVLEREEEASRRKREDDSEFLRMLEERKRMTDGVNKSPSPVKPQETGGGGGGGVKQNKMQLMKERWESGALNLSTSSSSSSIISTPTSPVHHLPLSLPPIHPDSKGPTGTTAIKKQDNIEHEVSLEMLQATPSKQTVDMSAATSHSKVSPQKVTVSPGLSSLNSPSSSSRGGHEEIQKKYEEICNSKLQLENEKLDKELEIRNLKYKLDQKKGEFQAILDDKMKLEDQLNRTEEQMREKAEETQTLALKTKEIEMENLSLKINCQQLEEDLQNTADTLEMERQQHLSTESTYHEQKRLYLELKAEADRAIEQQKNYSEALSEVDTAKNALAEEIYELKETNRKLKAELVEKKSHFELTQNQLETQLDELREEVTERREKDALMKSNLSDLSGKVETLTATLDRETTTRQKLEEQLSLARNEVSQLQLEKARSDKASLESNQELLREKLALEKDMSTAKEEKQRLSLQLENAQGKLIATEQELKSTVSLVSDKSNQLSNLQRQVDQLQHYQQTSQDALMREKEKVSQLESQLAAASEKLNTSLTEQHRVGVKVEAAEKKAIETEETLKREQVFLNETVSSLRIDLEKANNEVDGQMEQVLSLREQLSASETSRALLETKLQRLQQETNAHSELIASLEDKLKSADDAFIELKEEREGLEGQFSVQQSTLISREEELRKSKDMLDQFKEALNKAQKSIKDTVADRDRQMRKKTDLEVKLVEAEGRANLFLSELSTGAEHIKQLQLEIEQLNQSRVSLQELAAKLRTEVVDLDAQLDTERSYRSKAEQENSELKELWENEVKAKHKITEKFMLLEQECKESGDVADTEKQKLLRAVEQKGMAEMKMETLHERIAQLQRENGELKGQLKSFKKRVKDVDKLDSTAHTLRQELDQTQSSHQAEISMLQKQVQLYQEQLKKEIESRQTIEQKSSSLQIELNSLQKSLTGVRAELHEKEKALRKSEKSMTQLREELLEMEGLVNRKMVPKSELETVTRQMEEKSHEDFSKKIAEFNDLLEQQALNYQKQDSIRVMQENERREKQDKEITNLKQKLNGMMARYDKQHLEIENAFSEARRYKTLYEQEAKKKERLLAKLDRSRERTASSRLQLSYEKKQTKKLRDASYNVLSQLGASHKLPTSTPLRHTEAPPHSPPSEELLQSIHSELDQSLAKHLDSTAVSYKPGQPKFDSMTVGTKTESHLDSIRRNYRL